MIDKLNMQTKNGVADRSWNAKKFPTSVTEKIDAVAGEVNFAVDFDVLRQEFSSEVVKAIAKMQPQYAVLRDSSLADDGTATNFEQIFKTYSPSTTTKIL